MVDAVRTLVEDGQGTIIIIRTRWEEGFSQQQIDENIVGDSLRKTGIYALQKCWDRLQIRPDAVTTVGGTDAKVKDQPPFFRLSYNTSDIDPVGDQGLLQDDSGNEKAGFENIGITMERKPRETLPPVLTQVINPNKGEQYLELHFSKYLDINSIPAVGTFTVTTGTDDNEVTTVTIKGDIVRLTMTSMVNENTTVRYDPPAAPQARLQSIDNVPVPVDAIMATGNIEENDDPIPPVVVDRWRDNDKIFLEMSEDVSVAPEQVELLKERFTVQLSNSNSFSPGIHVPVISAIVDPSNKRMVILELDVSGAAFDRDVYDTFIAKTLVDIAKRTRIYAVVQIDPNATYEERLGIRRNIGGMEATTVINEGEVGPRSVSSSVYYASSIAFVKPWKTPSSRIITSLTNVNPVISYASGVPDNEADLHTYQGLNLLRRSEQGGFVTWGDRSSNGRTPIADVRMAWHIASVIDYNKKIIIDIGLSQQSNTDIRNAVLIYLQTLEQQEALYPGSDVWFTESENPLSSLVKRHTNWGMKFRNIISIESANFIYYQDDNLITQSLFGGN